jgi:multidrug efflux pump subunit AcrA (membrane-fusion protein)
MQGVTPTNDRPMDLATLPSHLDRIATPSAASGDLVVMETQFLRDIAETSQRVMQADVVATYRFDAADQIRLVNVVPSLEAFDALGTERVNRLAESAAQSQRTEIESAAAGCLIATTSIQPGSGATVVVTALDVGQAAIEPFVLSQQLITSAIATWHARCQQQHSATRNELQDRIIELIASAEESDSFSQFALTIVDGVAINLGAHQVAMCTQRGENISNIKVAAIGGGGAAIDHSLWQAAAAETLVRGIATRWPAATREDKAATIAHRELANATASPSQVISVPLLDETGMPLGVLAVVACDASAKLGQLAAVADAVGRSLVDWRRAHRSLLSRAISSVSRLLEARWSLFALPIVVAVVAMLPVPYRVSTEATVVPRTRSFVVAPHTGRVRNSMVRIGDHVARGATIAELDDRELRINLGSLLAERDRAVKQRDIKRASGDVAEEQLAEYELARVNEQIKLTRYRLSNLTVVSPIAGIVLDGKLEDVSGAPVETGQLLAEIAMLDQLWIEVHVPEDELSEVREGLPIRAAFDAAGGSVISAHIDSISPSAAVRGGKNVFVARALIENTEGLLRPGISGAAKIKAADRPLIAVLLRQVWRSISRLWI